MHYYLDIETEGIDKDGNNKKYKLADFKNGYTIIYFYPKDDTPVCTQEAYEFKEAMDKLNKYAAVIGVSSDSIEEHKEFKEKLMFILRLGFDFDIIIENFEDDNIIEEIIKTSHSTITYIQNKKIRSFFKRIQLQNKYKKVEKLSKLNF